MLLILEELDLDFTIGIQIVCEWQIVCLYWVNGNICILISHGTVTFTKKRSAHGSVINVAAIVKVSFDMMEKVLSRTVFALLIGPTIHMMWRMVYSIFNESLKFVNVAAV
jgi:hypothetical protein